MSRRRFLHATVGALFVSSVLNHSRPHDGPVYDDIDVADKCIVTINVAAAVADALRENVQTSTVLYCSSLSFIIATAYVVAFTNKQDEKIKHYVELIHAVCVHGLAAVVLTALIL